MLCLRKNKYHIAAALLTAVLLCPGSENFNKNSNLLAWWGTIYPQFCFMEAPRTENGQKAEPRFHFWIVDTLNALMLYKHLHRRSFGVKMKYRLRISLDYEFGDR